jgi:predicted MFS family arabinose efflux permease
VRLPASLGVLRERDFRLLWLGGTISAVGDGLAPIAVFFAVLHLTDSVSSLGTVAAAGWIPRVAFVLLGGAIADRLPRRRVMVASDLLQCAAQATLAALLISGAVAFWHIVALQLVRSTASAFFAPAAIGLTPQLVPPERLQPANAVFGLSASVVSVAAPGVSGALVAAAGPGSAIAVDAGTFLASASFLLALRPRLPVARPAAEPLVAGLAAGWREFRSRTWLWTIVVQFAVFHMLVYAPIVVLTPLIAKQSLGGAGALGIVQTAGAAGGVAGGLVALRIRPRRPLLFGTLITFGVIPALALWALRAPVAAIAVATIFNGMTATVFLALWETTLQREIPPHVLSRVAAWDALGSFAFIPVGLFLVGPISHVIGVSGTLWLGAAYTAASILVVAAVPDVRRVEAA